MFNCNTPLVTVIIPIYNVEKYLKICLFSILQQTYPFLEIILVDDGSTDLSSCICDEYAKKDSRIKVIHQTNEGLSSARNRGLNISQGEYIYFLDSDDCIHPQLIEIAVVVAIKRKCKIVQVELQLVESNFQNFNQVLPKNYEIYQFNKLESISNLDEDNQKYSKDIRLVTTVIWSKLYHKSIFDKLRFLDEIRIHEDQMVIHRLLSEANGMCFIHLPLYYYRNNESSLIRREWKADKLIMLDCYKDRLECVLEISDNLKGKARLVNLIYRRYLICIIKNYIMVMKYLNNEEKNSYLQQVHKRFREEFKRNYGANLSIKDKLLFTAFSLCPYICVKIYSEK